MKLLVAERGEVMEVDLAVLRGWADEHDLVFSRGVGERLEAAYEAALDTQICALM